MKKYTLMIGILINLFCLSGMLYSQISESEALSDIQDLLSVDDYIYQMQNQEYKMLEQKIKDNPEPYINFIEPNLYLPTDVIILSQGDSLNYYPGYIGLLFFIDNERAKNILEEEYVKQVSLLRSLRKQAAYAEKIDNWDEFKVLDLAHSTIMHLQIDFIRHCLGYNNESYIGDCLSRIDSVDTGFQANMVQYFIAVAPEDPHVALKICQMYTTPGSIIYNSDFYFEQYGYQYSDAPMTILEQMIAYIKQARQTNHITNQGIANSLNQKLENAKKQLEKGKTKQAMNMLNAFLNEVEAQKEKHLTSEAYALLKYNAEYLIQRLEED